MFEGSFASKKVSVQKKFGDGVFEKEIALRKRLDSEMLLLLKLHDHAIVKFVNTCTFSLTASIRPFICIEEIKREDFKP